MAADQDTMFDSKTSILVVDDSRVMRQALRRILSGHYQVLEAGDGEEGWALVMEDPTVSCVYTDLSMPRLDGYGLLQRIRESDDPRVRQIPVVLITGNEDSEGTRQRALSAGASGVVQKPFNTGDILNAARRYVVSSAPLEDSLPPAAAPGSVSAPAPSTAMEPLEAQQLRARVSELEGLLQELRGQLQGWQDEAQRAEASSLSASAEWEGVLEGMRRQLTESQEERNRLRKEHDRLPTELILRQQSSDEQRSSDRIRELESQLTAERSDLDRLRTEAADLAAELEASRDSAHEAASRADDLETRLQQVLSEQAEGREELTSLRRELESVRDDYQTLEQAMGVEQGNLSQMQARVQSLQEESSDWASRLADTEQELSEWQARARQAESALEQMGEESHGDPAAHGDLLRAVESERQRAADAEERAASVTQELTTERERLADLEEDLSAQRARAEAAERELESLQNEQQSLDLQTHDAETLEALRARAEAAELDQLQIEDELVDMASRMERSEAARVAAENELRALMLELADARRQLRDRASGTPPSLVGTAPPEQLEEPAGGEASAGLDAERFREDPDAGGDLEQGVDEPVVHILPDEIEEADVPELRVEAGDRGGDFETGPEVSVQGSPGSDRDSQIRQWEEERRRQRRVQVVILVSVAAVAALGLYFLLS